MDHSLQPRLHEYLFEIENAILTVPRAIGNLPDNPILENTEDVEGSSSTHRKRFDNDEIDA